MKVATTEPRKIMKQTLQQKPTKPQLKKDASFTSVPPTIIFDKSAVDDLKKRIYTEYNKLITKNDSIVNK